VSYVDMDGTTKEYLRPQKIGEFALWSNIHLTK
jgi:hypothetical protein